MGAPAIKYLATKAKIINPGDIAELPESYAGRDFLDPVEEPKEPEKTAEKKPNIFIYSTCAISEHKEKKKFKEKLESYA